MATKAAHKRLTKEYILMQENPQPYINARPNESNILEWHYLITGPPDTPYKDGQYHGTLTFPPEYPFKPPSIRMSTPSGRFMTNTRLCLSISDYHPKSWNPAWSVSTILTGLLSFMTSEEATTGSTNSSETAKRNYALNSRLWNNENNLPFSQIFPEEYEANSAKIMVDRANEIKKNAARKATRMLNPQSSNLTNKKIDLDSSAAAVVQRGWSTSRKMICALVVIVGWVVAARVIGA
ncbi:UBC-like protein [Nadsonia fulvescens var. elongata DSM 6958]|uniref:Ubiquitin-conjugating enzyme E2 6 n=1 Tax=Nadsonia fulvescens var. elongata DSM 6958 TaxID=857566 RepID=A0A1E3PIA9_9ASCO|nr:UBC-like protein [Nadsonia fulvescens var. elongata DSM 6958]